ncbi:hypothetical protein DSM03_11261 [Leeuwenhoekiella aestuarii]|nr:hypothetical protein DSM03_11261 [Leeuwenhoekiella aestuarii]
MIKSRGLNNDKTFDFEVCSEAFKSRLSSKSTKIKRDVYAVKHRLKYNVFVSIYLSLYHTKNLHYAKRNCHCLGC